MVVLPDDLRPPASRNPYLPLFSISKTLSFTSDLDLSLDALFSSICFSEVICALPRNLCICIEFEPVNNSVQMRSPVNPIVKVRSAVLTAAWS